MSFWTDLGNKITGQDADSLSRAEMNLSTANYLDSLAAGNLEPDSPEAKGDNSFLMVAIIGSLVVAGGVAYFALRKK